MSSKLSPADETFQSLMHGGAVTGLCLCAGPKVIRSRMPFSTRRIEGAARLVDEAFQHQADLGRQIDQIWFGLGTFNLLAVSHEGMRIIILHVRDEETDFLAQIGRLFLKDYGSDFIEHPEHKRLVTARILVTAPDSESGQAPPLSANPATSRIPVSARFIERQMPQGDGEAKDGAKPITPKPIRRPEIEVAVESGGDGEPSGDLEADSADDGEGVWSDFKQRLFSIMERAVGEERARSIIEAQIEAFAGDPQKTLPGPWLKEFGDTVIGKITKRPSRDRARNELVGVFREFSL